MRRTVKTIITTVAAIMIFLGTAGPSEAQLRIRIGGHRPPPPPAQPAAAPNPAPPPPSPGAGKRIVYSIPAQRVWLYEGQANIKAYPVSGRQDWPRPGNYEVFSKSDWATNGKVRMQYMVRFVPGGDGGMATGFHAIPVTRSGQPIQSEAELGQFRSHGCVRQSNADAAFLFNWASMRTPVTVLG